ncbi:hypothetical protein [Nonomuraea jabiensis]|uniref:Glycoside hydrolase family 2 domain-containing protein n=1 Tax=Nonomuraea jabiensis TaxID=882448 RepID=A0A7W9GGF5_9ACTN|nr:hypothetical protein [Nonomuraea jabiensis]MBB5783307.1 hypothetical protein [Nonomuraea jabiensis]
MTCSGHALSLLIPQAKDLTRRLVDLVHELDPTRPAAVGGAQRRGFDELGDVAGYNGDGASLCHKPPWPSLVSEYGSVIEDRPGTYGPRYAHGVETPHAWRSGIALWCGIHHGSIVPDMGRMGFIDYFRLPLRSWYWYRRELRGVEPPPWPLPGTATTLRLSADRMTIATDGTDDTLVMVELVDASGRVVADERPVRIEVVEGGGIFPTGTSITLSPDNRGLLDGVGGIEFRSSFAGPNTLRTGADGLAPVELTIEAVGGEAWRGRPRRLSPGPPSRSFMPSSGAPRLLSAKRPVFSSGSLADRPAHLVTDYSTGEGWISATNRPGAWVRVDLEGLWRVDTVTVLLGGPDAVPYRLEVFDGQAAEEVDRAEPPLITAFGLVAVAVQSAVNDSAPTLDTAGPGHLPPVLSPAQEHLCINRNRSTPATCSSTSSAAPPPTTNGSGWRSASATIRCTTGN